MVPEVENVLFLPATIIISLNHITLRTISWVCNKVLILSSDCESCHAIILAISIQTPKKISTLEQHCSNIALLTLGWSVLKAFQ